MIKSLIVLKCTYKTFDQLKTVKLLIGHTSDQPLPTLKTIEVDYHQSLPLKTNDQRLSPLYIAQNLQWNIPCRWSVEAPSSTTATSWAPLTASTRWSISHEKLHYLYKLDFATCDVTIKETLRLPENNWRGRTQVKGLANADTIRVGETDLNIGGEGGGHRWEVGSRKDTGEK